ncbi:PepSY-associated TM helix domain-containing protein [Tolypothrix sp. VBCCA 56010]|uniref:PepSY-associated TM helix domain-containing protein n=1 Tax=Tolypothrix sp. VBCCA 56010 TaxID=3137731 RepID=UPI003D7E7FAB
MSQKTIRNVAFTLHRYLGLVVGLILIIVGLTGSLLVFQEEIDHFLVHLQFGQVIPQGQRLSIESIVGVVQKAYDNSGLQLGGMRLPLEANEPIIASLKTPADQWINVFINPYTGVIMGEREWDQTIIGITFKLHYQLLAGQPGQVIVGIAALFLLILCITGIILWPGWRRLIAGFKIKWKAHIKRTNFDIHKLVGIIAAVFLAMIAFTGFCWNFYEQTEPVIYAATLTPKPPEPKSQPVPGKSIILGEVLKVADNTLPGAVTTHINFPTTPDGVLTVYKKFPEATENYSSRVYIDQFSGKVLQVRDSRSLRLGDTVLDSFVPMHYGTFGGLPTRILYVFVGLTPLILFVTGLIMWLYRWRKNKKSKAIMAPNSELISR